MKPDIFIDIDRSALAHQSVIEQLSSGKVLVVRQVPELIAYRDILIEETAKLSAGRRRHEIEALFHKNQMPSEEGIADISRSFSRLSRSYLLTTLFAQLYLDTRLPQPNLADYGGLRFVMPPAMFKRMRQRPDLLTKEDWEGPQDPPDPGWYGVLMTRPALIHRDIGGPHFTFQANFWCALQDLAEHETLIFFPESYRDTRPDNYYLPLKGDNPAQWGYGEPASVAMKAGDLLLFHGEQYHASPVYAENTVRISQDIRLIGSGWDDNGWYRGGFLNLRNFMPRESKSVGIATTRCAQHLLDNLGTPPARPLDWIAANPECALGIQMILWSRNQAKSTTHVAAMNEASKQLPFAEDRFAELYFLLRDSNDGAGLRESIERFVIDRTTSYFWACIFGGLALDAGHAAIAKRAFARARSLARATRNQLDCSRNPIDYFAANAQQGSERGPFLSAMAPEDVDEVVRLYQSGTVQAIGSNTYTMFRPYYPYVLGKRPRIRTRLRRILGMGLRKPVFPPRQLFVNPTYPPPGS